MLRHRRRCKYWKSITGCYRGEQCLYLHQCETKVTEKDAQNKDFDEKLKQVNKTKTVEKTVKDMETQTEELEEQNKSVNENKRQLSD